MTQRKGSIVLAILASVAAISVAVDFPPIGPTFIPPVHRPASRCTDPVDLDDAHQVLAQFLAPEIVEGLRGSAGRESTVALAVARELRNVWGLWNGSRLRNHLLQRGLRHPDEMSELILVTFRRYLRGEPEHVAEEVQRLRTGVLRPTPHCPPCVRAGECTREEVINGGLGPDRGFVIEDCCCGLRPLIIEGTVESEASTGHIAVHPSMVSAFYRISCRYEFGNLPARERSRPTTR